MKRLLLAFPMLVATSVPAYATAGMFCSTGGAQPVEVSLVISRVVAAPLVSASLRDRGIAVQTEKAQWWLDAKDMRLILIDPNAERAEIVLIAKRRGDDYVGSLTRAGRSRRVRCEESG